MSSNRGGKGGGGKPGGGGKATGQGGKASNPGGEKPVPNLPSKTGKPSGDKRGNYPPGGKP